MYGTKGTTHKSAKQQPDQILPRNNSMLYLQVSNNCQELLYHLKCLERPTSPLSPHHSTAGAAQGRQVWFLYLLTSSMGDLRPRVARFPPPANTSILGALEKTAFLKVQFPLMEMRGWPTGSHTTFCHSASASTVTNTSCPDVQAYASI